MPRTIRSAQEQIDASSKSHPFSSQFQQQDHDDYDHDDDGRNHFDIIDAPFHQVTPSRQVAPRPVCTASQSTNNGILSGIDHCVQTDGAVGQHQSQQHQQQNAPRKPLQLLYHYSSQNHQEGNDDESQQQQEQQQKEQQNPLHQPPQRRLDFFAPSPSSQRASADGNMKRRLLFSNRVFNVNFPLLRPVTVSFPRSAATVQQQQNQQDQENQCPRCLLPSTSKTCACTPEQQQLFFQRKFTLHLLQVINDKRNRQHQQIGNDNDADDGDDGENQSQPIRWGDVRKTVAGICDCHPDSLLLLFADAPVCDDGSVERDFNELPVEGSGSIIVLNVDAFIVPSRFSAPVTMMVESASSSSSASCCSKTFGLVQQLMNGDE